VGKKCENLESSGMGSDDEEEISAGEQITDRQLGIHRQIVDLLALFYSICYFVFTLLR